MAAAKSTVAYVPSVLDQLECFLRTADPELLGVKLHRALLQRIRVIRRASS